MLFWLAAGCAAAPHAPPQAAAPPPVTVDFEIHGEGDPVAAAYPAREQSPEVKLRLGHYSSGRLGVGLVIDRTNEKIAKVRFDGTGQTIKLEPQYYWHRTEYWKALTGAPNDKLLVVDHTGHVALHMEGLGDHGASLYRDGDADPL